MTARQELLHALSHYEMRGVKQAHPVSELFPAAVLMEHNESTDRLYRQGVKVGLVVGAVLGAVVVSLIWVAVLFYLKG